MGLYLKGDSYEKHLNNQFSRPLIKMCYYNAWELEILSLSKLDLDCNLAFITLTTTEPRKYIFTNGFPERNTQSKHRNGQKL